MSFVKIDKKRREEKVRWGRHYHGPSAIAVFFITVAVCSLVVAYSVSIVPVALWLYNTARPKTASQLAQVLRDTKLDYSRALMPKGGLEASPRPVPVRVPDKYLPAQEPDLSPFPHLRIAKLGVDTGVWEASYDNYEDALMRGVWRVPEFGDPTTSTTSPMILVAHRYGYLEWTNEFRRLNSFYNLPKLQVGDKIEVDWDQRPFMYEVVKIEEGSEIEEYNHPLIMYTCKYLVSDKRIIVYADRVN